MAENGQCFAVSSNLGGRNPSPSQDDELGYQERLDLMMRHAGLTRDQAEVEAEKWN